MENIKGLSLDEAMVCPYLTAVYKWIWITNTAFPSSSRELFVVGDLLLGPRGWDPSVRGTLGGGVSSSALRCHARALQKGQSTSRVSGIYQLLGKIHGEHSCTSRGCQLNTPVLEDSAVKGEPSWESWSQLSCSRDRWTEGWRAQRERVHDPQPPARWQGGSFRVKHVAILGSSFRWLSHQGHSRN